MASIAREVVFSAYIKSRTSAKFHRLQIKEISVRSRPAEVVCGSSQRNFSGVSYVTKHAERRTRHGATGAASKWACRAVNSVEQKDLFLQGGEAVSQALEQLRQLVKQKGGNVEAADDMEMLRFLRARSMDLEKAATAFVSHQTWRSEFVPEGGFTEADLPTELAAKKSYWIARDRKGRPVVLTLGRNHVYNKQDFAEFTRFSVYAVDKVISGIPPGIQDFVAIVDLKGLGVKNLDSKSFIAAFDLLQNHYPGRVDKIYMINVPLIFNGLWKVVSKFLEEGTKEKIIFVDKKKVTETLLEEIDIDYLPKEYGGNADLILLQDGKVSS